MSFFPAFSFSVPWSFYAVDTRRTLSDDKHNDENNIITIYQVLGTPRYQLIRISLA